MQHKSYIVIGAGVSGLSSAQVLKKQGKEVLVLEKADRPGGLIKCDVVDGHLFHKVGGHVFNSRNKAVVEWFWNFFNQEQEFISAKRKASIYMMQQFLEYPLENDLAKLGDEVVASVVADLLTIERQKGVDAKPYENFADFLNGNFGETLYKLYFEPYNNKIWKTDLSKVDLPWLDGKLPMPNAKEMLVNNILRKEEGNMVHSSFFYPQKGGSQSIADRLAEGIDLVYNFDVKKIDYTKGKWIIDGQYSADNLIYTGDIRLLHKMVRGIDCDLLGLMECLSQLKSNGTTTMLCETDDTDLSWLYLPEGSTPAHRIIYTGNFSPNNNGLNARKSCSVEFSGKTELPEMLEAIKYLPGNLKYITHNYEPNSYVIQQVGEREWILKLKQLFKASNFYLIGRFAEWEYHNMDKAMESAINTLG